jgi:hypothetical protein
MAAKATEVTHFLFESKPLWSGRIGAAGVSDATVQTIPLESATNLTNGNAYVFRMGRVDENGVKRAQNLTEVSIGKLSSTNFIDCVRGSEGTAQGFAAGTVVEILFTSTHWDKLIEFLGVEHGPTGVHTSALVTTLKATGAEVDTGTSDTKIVTPKAMEDSDYVKTANLPVTASNTVTFTNKRTTKRVQSVANAATVTPDADANDVVDITAIAQAFTIANPSGTPTNFQQLIIRIKDNATARAITWGNGYVAGGVALPSTTVLSKILNLGFQYNTANALNKWQLVASSQEA